MNDKIVEFKGTIERCVYNSEDFKVYGCSVNSFEYPDIQIGKYGTCTINGNIQELNLGTEYIIKAKETSNKYGICYEVINIRREKPTSLSSSRTFLYEILTERQADNLLSVYPDIVNMIMKNKVDNIDLTKVYGVGDKTFEVIKRKVIENFKLADLVEEFKGVFSLSVIKKIYDKYPSVERIREKLREDPYECLCKLNGVGFKTADEMLLKIEKKSKESIAKGEKPILHFGYNLSDSYQRAKACVDYLLQENENSGNTYMHIAELKKQFESLVPNCIGHLAVILKTDKDIVFDRENMAVCTKIAYNTELFLASRVKEAITIKTKFDCDYSKYKSVNGCELTEEQQKTCQYMCENNFVILLGVAGSGKSFSTQAFINMLKDNNKSYKLFAPTGKAAKVLEGYTGEKTSTIHRGLGYMPPDTWNFNEENKLDVDVVIVDEFSMVDIFLFKHLLEAIDFNRTKLLLIGDPFQLASVGAGGCLYDLSNYDAIPKVVLDKVFRYGQGGLLTVATDIRNNKDYLNKEEKVQSFGEDKAYTYLSCDQEKIVFNTVKLYKKLLEQGYQIEDIGVLTAYNVGDYGTVAINKEIQKEINPNPIGKITYGETEYRTNDIVVNIVNDYKAVKYNEEHIDINDTTFIANGETGRIVKVLKDAIVIDYDGLQIYCPKSSLKNIKLAYCISLHKSQGSGYKIVIVLSPRAHTYMITSNLLYVGITRAKEKCYHFGEYKTISFGLKKKETIERKTMLLKFLRKEN